MAESEAPDETGVIPGQASGPLPTTELLTDRQLGDFALIEKLGEGGFGAVYRAEQVGLGREAVVKVLHPALRSQVNFIQRFLREAKLASSLDHPFAAHIYAFGAEADGLLWIAMELVRGTPLNEVLNAQDRLLLPRFVPLFERICEVVHAAHEAGIVHRDLKPANVMVLSHGGRLSPKLLDFGIAKLEGATPLPEDEGPPGRSRLRDGPVPATTENLSAASPLTLLPPGQAPPRARRLRRSV